MRLNHGCARTKYEIKKSVVNYEEIIKFSSEDMIFLPDTAHIVMPRATASFIKGDQVRRTYLQIGDVTVAGNQASVNRAGNHGGTGGGVRKRLRVEEFHNAETA